MTDSFRFGKEKNIINFEQFLSKLNSAEIKNNKDLWKFFSLFDSNKNGKIDTQPEIREKETEAEYIFKLFKNAAGEDGFLEDSEIEEILRDPQISSQFNNTQNLFTQIKSFVNSLIDEDNSTVTENGIKITRKDGKVLKREIGESIITYTYHKGDKDRDDYVEINDGNGTVYEVKEVDRNGRFLDENFIKKVSKNENGQEVTTTKIRFPKNKNDNIIETVKLGENEFLTTVYVTDSINVFETTKELIELDGMQIYIKDGQEYFISFDKDGNTVTHAANGDSLNSLIQKFGFKDEQEFYKLNPKLKGKTIKVTDPVVIPGKRDARDKEILAQGSIYSEIVEYLQFKNEQEAIKFKQKHLKELDDDVFNTLSKIEGMELSNDNVIMYFKLASLDTKTQKRVCDYIQKLSKEGKSTYEIKSSILYDSDAPQIEIQEMVNDKKVTTKFRINLFDGFTVNLHDLNTGNKNRDEDNLLSVQDFLTKVCKFDITKDEGKDLYDKLSKVYDSSIYMDLNSMFQNILYRTSNSYKNWHESEYKKYNTSLRNSVASRDKHSLEMKANLEKNPPLSSSEAKNMIASVIKEMTNPPQKTKYHDFVENNKGYSQRVFAATMVQNLYSSGSKDLTESYNLKDALNPSKLFLAFGWLAYETQAQGKDLNQNTFMGNDKFAKIFKGKTNIDYNPQAIKECMDVMNNPKSTDSQKAKAIQKAFGSQLLNSHRELAEIGNVIDSVADMALMIYATGAIGKFLNKIAGSVSKVSTATKATQAIAGAAKGINGSERITQIVLSATNFGIWEGGRYTVNYFTNGIEEDFSYGSGLVKSAGGGAIFGTFASLWGQLATQPLLKLLFKAPETETITKDAMSALSRNLGKSGKIFTSGQVRAEFMAAQAAATTSASKEGVSFVSELMGFSLYEVAQKLITGNDEQIKQILKNAKYNKEYIESLLQNREELKVALKDAGCSDETISELTEINLWNVLKGQTKTLLSFKAIGKLVFMHKAGKLSNGFMELDKNQELRFEPTKQDGKDVFRVIYPDGKEIFAQNMKEVLALSNAHYEDITLYKPLEELLTKDGKMELDKGITLYKDLNGYSVVLEDGTKVKSKDLREVMAKAQNEYTIKEYEKELDKNGQVTLLNKQIVTFDSENKVYKTKLESGTEIEASSFKELLQKSQKQEYVENIEKSFDEERNVVFLDPRTMLKKNEDGSYRAYVIQPFGEVIVVEGASVEKVLDEIVKNQTEKSSELEIQDDVDDISDGNESLSRDILGDLLGQKTKKKTTQVSKKQLEAKINNLPDGRFKDYAKERTEYYKGFIQEIAYPRLEKAIDNYNEILSLLQNATNEKLKQKVSKMIDECIQKEDISSVRDKLGNIIQYIKINIMPESQKFLYYLERNNSKLYAELQKTPEKISNPKYREIKEDFLKMEKYETTILECRIKSGTEEAEALYENYLNEEHISNNAKVDARIKEMCRQINKDFGVKIFLPSNIKSAGEGLKAIYIELAKYQIYAKRKGAKAVMPPTLDFFKTHPLFIKDGIMGICKHDSKAISLKNFTIKDIREHLDHELTHANDTEELDKFPEGFNPYDYKQEFINADVSMDSFLQACMNPKEFIAVASQGDISKYSEKFKSILKEFGMPEWMLDMSRTLTPDELKKITYEKRLVDDLIKGFDTKTGFIFNDDLDDVDDSDDMDDILDSNDSPKIDIMERRPKLTYDKTDTDVAFVENLGTVSEEEFKKLKDQIKSNPRLPKYDVNTRTFTIVNHNNILFVQKLLNCKEVTDKLSEKELRNLINSTADSDIESKQAKALLLDRLQNNPELLDNPSIKKKISKIFIGITSVKVLKVLDMLFDKPEILNKLNNIDDILTQANNDYSIDFLSRILKNPDWLNSERFIAHIPQLISQSKYDISNETALEIFNEFVKNPENLSNGLLVDTFGLAFMKPCKNVEKYDRLLKNEDNKYSPEELETQKKNREKSLKTDIYKELFLGLSRNKEFTEISKKYYKLYLENEFTDYPPVEAKRLREMCETINDEFGVKVILPANLKEAGQSLILIYQELSNYKMQSKGQAKMPPVLDFISVLGDKVAGEAHPLFGGNNIDIRELSVEFIKHALRHELAHINDNKLLEKFPEEIRVFKIEPNYDPFNGKPIFDPHKDLDLDKCKYVEELRNAGIPERYIEYAYTNPMEFIAIASQGDFRKYSEEFKKYLVELGMPKWMLNFQNLSPFFLERDTIEKQESNIAQDSQNPQMPIFSSDILSNKSGMPVSDFKPDDKSAQKYMNNRVPADGTGVNEGKNGGSNPAEVPVFADKKTNVGSGRTNPEGLTKAEEPVPEDAPTIATPAMIAQSLGVELVKADAATAKKNIMPILTDICDGDRKLVAKIMNKYNEDIEKLYAFLLFLPEKNSKTKDLYKGLLEVFKQVKNLDNATAIIYIGNAIYNSINSVKHVYFTASQRLARSKAKEPETVVAEPPKVSNKQIRQAVYEIMKDYRKQYKKIHDDLVKLGFAQLGDFKDRLKSEQSLYDKIANYIKEHPGVSLEEAMSDVRDAYACRTVIKSKNFMNHPEVVKLREQGDEKGALLRAAELQSEPALKMLENMIQAQADGKSKYQITRLSNYVTKDGIPYFSERQLANLKQFAANKGIKIEFVEKVDEKSDSYDEIDKTKYKPTTKSQPSGYTAFQMNMRTPDGKIIEWQFRGEEVDAFAEGEHIVYDLRTNKNIIGRYTELQPLYEPIKKLLNKKNMPDNVYQSYNRYLGDYYIHLRELELGNKSTEPKLSDYGVDGFKFDSRLEAKNLMRLHHIAEQLKKGEITQAEALVEFEVDKEQVNNVRKNYEKMNVPDDIKEILRRNVEGALYDIKTGASIDLRIQDWLNNPEVYDIKRRCQKFDETIPSCIVDLVVRNKSYDRYDRFTGLLINDVISEYLNKPEIFKIKELIYSNSPESSNIPLRIRELVEDNKQFAELDEKTGTNINDAIADYLDNPEYFEFKCKVKEEVEREREEAEKKAQKKSLPKGVVKSTKAKVPSGIEQKYFKQAKAHTTEIPNELKLLISANNDGVKFDAITGVEINAVIREYMKSPETFKYEDVVKNLLLEQLNNSYPELAKLASEKKCTKIDGKTDVLDYEDIAAIKKVADVDYELAKFMLTEVNNYQEKDEAGNIKCEELRHYYFKQTASFVKTYKLKDVKTLLMVWRFNTGECTDFLDKYSKLIPTITKELKRNSNFGPENPLSDYTYFLKDIGDTDNVALQDAKGFVYKFDKKTGKLTSVEHLDSNMFMNKKTDTVSEVHVEREYKDISGSKNNEFPTPLLEAIITDMEISIYNKDGQRMSHEEFLQSKIPGEYEIYDSSTDGKLYKIGIAEISPNGDKSIEKTLTSLDGTTTKTVYHEDSKGNRFIHNEITDAYGKTLSKTTRTFKVIDENHFVSTEDGQAFDVQFTDEKVVITQLDENNQMTTKQIEYKLDDYSKYETEREIKISNDRIMAIAKRLKVNLKDNSKENIENIRKVYREYYKSRGLDHCVDKRLLPLLKQIPGSEWFKLDRAGLLSIDYLDGNTMLEINSYALGPIVLIGKAQIANLSTAEHEFGHVLFLYLQLYANEEIMNTYKQEKQAFLNTFGRHFAAEIGYFLNDAIDITGYRGINETSAESNSISNMHSQYNSIQARTAILQHYFPRTIALITNAMKLANMEQSK